LDQEPAIAPRSPDFLRISLGLVYLHFGILKFFPDLSPAEMLATQTIMILSLGWLDAHAALILLGIFECAIGLGFLFAVARRWLPWVFFAHMLGTAMPLFVLPEFVFKFAPFAPTLEGQYIMKNLVFVAAGWTVLVPPIRLARPSLRGTRIWSSERGLDTTRAEA
jgi:uncharacterized membrane protein YphA (DoxX/SURF4 family)